MATIGAQRGTQYAHGIRLKDSEGRRWGSPAGLGFRRREMAARGVCRAALIHRGVSMTENSIKVWRACAASFSLMVALQAPAVANAQQPSTAPAPAPAFRQGRNSRGFPEPNRVPGQPIETRPPEKSDDKPAFPGQTRAPYEKTAPYTVTVITDRLRSPWSLAFLPDGKFLVTEKPGDRKSVV